MLDGPDGTTRREFIAWVAGILGGVGIGRALPHAKEPEPEPQKPARLVHGPNGEDVEVSGFAPAQNGHARWSSYDRFQVGVTKEPGDDAKRVSSNGLVEARRSGKSALVMLNMLEEMEAAGMLESGAALALIEEWSNGNA